MPAPIFPPPPSPFSRSRPPRQRLARQVGNALVFALLGLVVSGLAALGVMRSARLQARREAGNAEAGILDTLRNAANAAILDQLPALQAGQPLARNGVVVPAVTVGGVPTWQPTVDELKAMGYLPPQWALARSVLNHAPYLVSFHLSPASCSNADCGVDGQVLLAGALVDGHAGAATASDGALIGPLLTRLGVDSGVSLSTSPATLTGYGNTWSAPNPVAGHPAGVVAVRVGTLGAAWSQFVRIGDTRDPDLRGNLTVAGDTTFGAPGAAHVTTVNGTLQVNDAARHPCVQLRPDGSIAVQCAGHLDAITGRFTDAAGHQSTIGPDGVATTGRVHADDGLDTPAVRAFAADDPTALQVKAGDLLVRGADGGTLVKVSATGDVVASQDVVAARTVSGSTLRLTSQVTEGDPCESTEVALLGSGTLATCHNGRYQAAIRYAPLDSACTVAGQLAVETSSSEQLVCRNGRYGRLDGFMSQRVFMSSFVVVNGTFLSYSEALPQGCPAFANQTTSQALVFLLPGVDANTDMNFVLNRRAVWDGPRAGWAIALTDGAGAPTASAAIAEVFCEYR